MGQNGRVANHQRHTCGLGRSLQIDRLLATKSNNRQMFGSLSLLQPGDGGADVVPRAFEIDKHYHGTGLLGAFDQSGSVRKRFDPVLQILQPIHNLTAGEEFFVKYERERFGHGVSFD